MLGKDVRALRLKQRVDGHVMTMEEFGERTGDSKSGDLPNRKRKSAGQNTASTRKNN